MERMLKIGELVGLLNPLYNDRIGGEARYIKHRVVRIIDKGGYNMYICEHIKTKSRATITDIDVITSIRFEDKKYEVYKNKSRPSVRLYDKK